MMVKVLVDVADPKAKAKMVVKAKVRVNDLLARARVKVTKEKVEEMVKAKVKAKVKEKEKEKVDLETAVLEIKAKEKVNADRRLILVEEVIDLNPLFQANSEHRMEHEFASFIFVDPIHVATVTNAHCRIRQHVKVG